MFRGNSYYHRDVARKGYLLATGNTASAIRTGWHYPLPGTWSIQAAFTRHQGCEHIVTKLPVDCDVLTTYHMAGSATV